MWRDVLLAKAKIVYGQLCGRHCSQRWKYSLRITHSTLVEANPIFFWLLCSVFVHTTTVCARYPFQNSMIENTVWDGCTCALHCTALHVCTRCTRMNRHASHMSSKKLFNMEKNFNACKLPATYCSSNQLKHVCPPAQNLSLIHIWRCRRSTLCRSRWSPYH